MLVLIELWFVEKFSLNLTLIIFRGKLEKVTNLSNNQYLEIIMKLLIVQRHFELNNGFHIYTFGMMVAG